MPSSTSSSNSPPSSLPPPETLQSQDMERERKGCSFSIDSMSCLLPGSRSQRDHSRWLLSLLKQDPDRTFDKEARVFQSRNQRFFQGQRIALRYFEIRNLHGLEKKDADLLRLYTDEYLPIQVHESMAQPTLRNQSSDDQWKSWGPMFRSGRWIGCYMQTELAHGSNLSRLRTTATLDLETDQWIIHTPEPSAGKCWIGGSGMTATHGIVMANLVIRQRSYGMHPFLVPLRDLETHRLLPGRSILEMGCKYGAPAMDNGYIRFDNVRVPRTHLLQRFQTVDERGNYVERNSQSKVMIRGTMTLVRVGLCEIAAHHASRATVIAIRYATVRRQGSSKTPPASLEPQIIDYPSVQSRLFTALAASYALTFASQDLRKIYQVMIDELESEGRSRLLPIVHGISSTLKAVCTNESLSVVERCRRSMGGHGYSQAAGFDFERNQPNAGIIYEGENTMLLAGPAANFLVKQFGEIRNQASPGGMLVPPVAQLACLAVAGEELKFQGLEESDLLDHGNQLDILAHRVSRLVGELSELRSSSGPRPSSSPESDVVKDHMDSSLATRASRAFGQYLIAQSFVDLVSSLRSRPRQLSERIGAEITQPMIESLSRLCSIYALENCILSDLGDFTEDSYLSSKQISKIRSASARTLAGLRRDALGLAESFDHDDWYLCSPLGSSDGRAYERMIDWMKLEPLNLQGEEGGRDENGVMKGYRQGVGRLIRGETIPFDLEAEQRRREKEGKVGLGSKL
ncbi:acyl-CoA oxidase [Violaceomyces palustris]|uniref:Acyl-CoA oxidase n=1 Tax=Violaceomyces palustris TaxID=1673888 RepID=A0ACD0P4Z4_9BASI|nr:acyl-CoA oxidase [Violaceomyces palustris]